MDKEKELTQCLEVKGISRREFIKYCAATAAVLGLSELEFTAKVARALEAASEKPPVIWLEGQDCAGCTVSFTGTLNPPVSSLILDRLSIRYHETIMVASGHLSESAYHHTVKQGGHVLIVEGSIPSVDDRFCMVGGRPFREIVMEAAEKAAAVIAVGACASYGGIPAAGPTNGIGLDKALPGRTIINLPTCPVHPEHLVGTILYYITTGKAPALDEFGRPKVYFGQSVHDNCRRRSYFDEGMFLTDWNDPAQKDWCLYDKGCKGPYTYSDCPIRRWNNGVNSCIDCGAGCQGCPEPDFYDAMAPLYTADNERYQSMLAKGFTAKKKTA
jgi:hydrogenase small subunit